MATEAKDRKGKIMRKLTSFGRSRSSAEPAGLVKPNLLGPILPPESRSGAELAAVASIHPDIQQSEEGLFKARAHPDEQLQQESSSEKCSETKVFLSEGASGHHSDPTPAGRVSFAGDREPSTSEGLAECLRTHNASGHQGIHDLAEHYKGRSRRMAAARELNRASSEEERVGVILDHQLKDIDSI